MKTIIFLNRESYHHDCYEFGKFPEINNFRKIAIIGNDFKDFLPPKYHLMFDKIYVINSDPEKIDTAEIDYLDLSHLCKIVKSEITLSGGYRNVYIITADETNVILAAYLRKKFSLFGDYFNVVQRYRDKIVMKQRLKHNGVKTADFIKFDVNRYKDNKISYYNHICSSLSNQFIIKPALGSASFDTFKISCLSDFQNLNIGEVYNLSNHAFIVEEFIDASIFSCDTLVYKGEIIYSLVSEYSCPPLDSATNKKTCMAIPLPYNSKQSNKITRFAHNILMQLDLISGFNHMEIFERNDGSLIFLEVGARPPGGKSPFCYKVMFNVDLFHHDLLAQIGILNNLNKNITYSGNSCLWGIVPKKYGRINSIKKPEIKSNIDIKWSIKEGDYIDKTTSSITSPAGIFTATNTSYWDLYQDFKLLTKINFYE